MTSRERAARLFMPGLPHAESEASFTRLLAETPPAGLLLFRRDGGDTAGLARRIGDLRARAAAPLLIAVDEEGGFVTQIAPDFEPAPSARVLGRAGDAEACLRFGQETGWALATLGIDIDFSPDFDVDSEPANPVIGPRAFSPDASEVMRLALAFARGLERGGVLWCAKHFPGHGATGVDSHHVLPVDASGRDEIERVHLAPFRAAIEAGTPIVMVAHVSYPALERDGDPATLSRSIATGLLREQLGFGELAITDAMEMKAIADRAGSGEAAVRAFEAGCDLLLYGVFDRAVDAAIDAVAAAIDSGRLSDARLREAELRRERLFERARRVRKGARAPEAPLDDEARRALCRRALRVLEPVPGTARLPQGSGAGIVVEPRWTAGGPLATLLSRELGGVVVRSVEWEQAGAADFADAAWVVLAHARRIAPTPADRAVIEAAQNAPAPTLLVAFGQDAFLADVPRLLRLSAGDPGETMRRVVAEVVAPRLGTGSRDAPGQPGALASR